MHGKRTLIFLWSVATAAGWLTMPPAVIAADDIEHLLDDNTVAVAMVRLDQVDIESTIDSAIELIPTLERDVEKVRATLQGMVDQLSSGGANQAYVVFCLSDRPRDIPFIVCPMYSEERAAKLAKSLRVPDERWTPRQKGSLAILGSPQTHERLKTVIPRQDSYLYDALIAGQRSSAQLAVALSEDHRRVLRELYPTLPAELGGEPITAFLDGFLWASFSVDLSPQVALNAVIKSSSVPAAESFHGMIEGGFEYLAGLPIVTKVWPRAGEALPLLVPRVMGDQLRLKLVQESAEFSRLLKSLAQPLAASQKQSDRMRAMNQLKYIVLAMHNFHDTHRSFPAVGNRDASGQGLLSWRVHLLPYLDQMELYEQFHLDEAWDSPHNKKLISKMPDVFLPRTSQLKLADGKSIYRLPIGDATVFPKGMGTPIRDITDGTSNTILVVEVADEHAEVWTKPAGWALNSAKPVAGLGGHFEEVVLVAFADGSVHAMPKAMTKDKWLALLSRNGRELVDSNWW